jgi:hypothetical protein
MENQNILSEQKKIALVDCAKWARILGIATIASIVISLISSIIQLAGNGVGMAAVLGSTLIGGSISIASAVLLMFFYKHTMQAVTTEDNHTLERAFYNFKWYFALLGIIVIIALCFACIGGLFAGIMGATA